MPSNGSVVVTLLVIAVIAVGPCRGDGPALVNEVPPSESGADFVDQWVLSGDAIGNALGAVTGQMLFSALFGPAGWAVGSFVGGYAGGLMGEWVDNRVGRAYNYASFSRPPFGEPGNIVLRNAGPMEQLLYQVDARGVVGGNLAGMGMHYALKLAARSTPGLGVLMNPVVLFVADYVAAIVADNGDGMVDLAAVGAVMDRRRGFDPDEPSSPRGWELYEDEPLTARELYSAAVEALENSRRGAGAEDRTVEHAWRRYDEVSTPAERRTKGAP